VLIHGSVSIDHAFREILRSELTVGAIEIDQLSELMIGYCEIWLIFSALNIPPFSTLSLWNRLSIVIQKIKYHKINKPTGSDPHHSVSILSSTVSHGENYGTVTHLLPFTLSSFLKTELD
jgi:hypothetical protein